ncbi:hypothetical protein TRFO_38327 [Tritrichomonas foetus]|uniref:DH domain-containing protein n=1 Tax=Tritrichomonas foetus TaxID=1144522 RepID=A0A1J4J8T8_9EUKA|nr:hypothetical protein TRFO_38327 [Tritrichomonas foetus]|eukprot:OHS95598.1 hypothetical protein TRFO_38327 [Tritrichomonas foetus]
MSKTQNEFICFVTPGQPTTYEEYADFENLSTSEILLKLDNSSNLCLRTPFFIKPLQHDSKPLQEYKDLKIVEKLKQYERPPKFLTFDNDLNFISILVTPKAIKCHHIIPPFFVKFFIDEIPNKTSEFVKNEILLKIGFKVNSATIHFDSNSISDDENAESIIEKAQNQKLYIDLVLPDLSISRLRKRVNILGEILSTEKTYINDLTLIIEKWQSGLEKFFEPEDFQTIFKDIAVIKSCHERFLNDFEKSGTTYDSQVSVPFIEFAPFFKVSQQYIANYTEISEILNKYDKNKKFIQ